LFNSRAGASIRYVFIGILLESRWRTSLLKRSRGAQGLI
jgi:hypothetical protein